MENHGAQTTILCFSFNKNSFQLSARKAYPFLQFLYKYLLSTPCRGMSWSVKWTKLQRNKQYEKALDDGPYDPLQMDINLPIKHMFKRSKY